MSGTPGPQRAMTEEERRLDEARGHGSAVEEMGTLPQSGSGEPCAKTIARAETPGIIFHTTRRALVHIAGARMDSPAFRTTIPNYVSRCSLEWTRPHSERAAFGLTNSEGNHGEDVKEYYFYLDSTPTHSYMKYLYKYPQSVTRTINLIQTNRRRAQGP